MSSHLSSNAEPGPLSGPSQSKSEFSEARESSDHQVPSTLASSETTPLLTKVNSETPELESAPEQLEAEQHDIPEHKTVFDIIYDSISTMLGMGIAGLIGTVIVLVVLIQSLSVDKWMGKHSTDVVSITFQQIDLLEFSTTAVNLRLRGEVGMTSPTGVESRILAGDSLLGVYFFQGITVEMSEVMAFFKPADSPDAKFVLGFTANVMPFKVELTDHGLPLVEFTATLSNFSNPLCLKLAHAMFFSNMSMEVRYETTLTLRKGWFPLSSWQISIKDTTRPVISPKNLPELEKYTVLVNRSNELAFRIALPLPCRLNLLVDLPILELDIYYDDAFLAKASSMVLYSSSNPSAELIVYMSFKESTQSKTPRVVEAIGELVEKGSLKDTLDKVVLKSSLH